ncbi:WS/DGAT/MGAT family O-acyltransferase [Sphingorhabdus sp. 109]|jgi:WS/DGAT/MGAT family acyltransferase|uniref:WS/DGAT/MGAT family O-acyltransferase n=1 Tax=Sphingorhabdus sp. 109 TaxID=2653173 RepID=UPI0012EF2836|nr:wax ester/triacylglycerol synthase family O-acyltransferase [Sphingorhabdus sp. 109]VWX56675.1 Wax ester/triacylglycerol synthase family O-acyltransferase [Sphingorhabdus sp. 109]
MTEQSNINQLSAQDAQFLYIQSATNLTHVMAVYIYDPSTAPGGKVRFKDIIEHMRKRMDVSPMFKRKLYRLPLDIDHPYWVEDEHFDLEAHISHSRLPEPGDWRQFCIHVARHHSKPLDMNRPLWDMYVVEGLDNIPGYAKGSYAILTRIHHSTIDGVSGAHFFAAISDKDPHGTPAIPLPKTKASANALPTTAEILNRAINSTVTSPVKLTQALMKFTPALLSSAQKSLTGGADKTESGVPQTRFNAAVTPHKMFDAITFDLEELKQMRRKVQEATINDVVLAICSGALRHYLTKHKELPDEPLVAVAPVNARSRSGEESNPGTNISAMTIKIWSNIEDPIERLEAIRDTTRETKAAKSGLSARIMTDLSKHIPGVTMAGVSRILTDERFAPKMSNLMVSNVPGPQIQLYMNGAKLTHQYGLAPLAHGMGLFIATPSYNGTISFSIISDRKIMPDIEFFRECLQKAFNELRDAKPGKVVQQPRKASEAPKKQPVSADGSVMYRRVAKKPRAVVSKQPGGARSKAS